MCIRDRKQIAEIVRLEGPITGQHIADKLSVTRAALRSDLAILVMSGIVDARPKVGYFFTGRSTLGLLTEEISDITVADIQSMPVVAKNTQSAYEAIVSMFVEDVGSVYVVDEKNLLTGVVSRKDLLKLAANNSGDLKSVPVVMAMTPLSKMIRVTPETTVAVAARKVIDNQIDSLPVVKCAVSYTHLDVYKRQGHDFPGRIIGVRASLRELLWHTETLCPKIAG